MAKRLFVLLLLALVTSTGWAARLQALAGAQLPYVAAQLQEARNATTDSARHARLWRAFTYVVTSRPKPNDLDEIRAAYQPLENREPLYQATALIMRGFAQMSVMPWGQKGAAALDSARTILKPLKKQREASRLYAALTLFDGLNAHYGRQQDNESLKFFLYAIELNHDCGQHSLTALSLLEAGMLYGRSGNIPEVQDMYNRAGYCARLDKNPLLEGGVYVNLADLYQNSRKPDSALLVLDRAIKLLEPYQANMTLAECHINRAAIYLNKKQLPTALAAIDQAMDYAAQNPVPRFWMEARMIKARIQLQMRQFDQALAQIQQAEALLVGKPLSAEHVKLADLRVQTLEKKGDTKGAYHAFVSYRKYVDSLRVPEQKRKQEALVANFMVKQRQMELASLEQQHQINQAREQRQRTYVISASAVLAVLLVLLLLGVRSNSSLKTAQRQLQENNQLIQRQYEHLQLANQAKDKLFNIVATDLRKPVNSFQQLPEMLEMATHMGDNGLLKDLAQELKTNATSLAQLLDRLLMWARAQSQTLQLLPEQVDVAAVLEQQLRNFADMTKRKALSVTLDCEPGLHAYADQFALETMVSNLLQNAGVYTPKGGSVTLRAYAEGEQAVIDITDTGVGIAPDVLAKLQLPLPVESTPGTGGEKGMGLGVLLVKELVSRSNGALDVESTQGQGSLFRLRLPLGHMPA